MLLDVRQRAAPDRDRRRSGRACKLMWPAGLMTGERRAGTRRSTSTASPRRRKRFAGVDRLARRARRLRHALPGGAARRARAVPDRRSPGEGHRASFVPIVDRGERGRPRQGARRPTTACCASARALYARNVDYYRRLQRADALRGHAGRAARRRLRLGEGRHGQRRWPRTRMLGTGLVAGFRTSGESERPGFAWFFGRDALWTRARHPLLRRLRGRAHRPRVPAQAPARRRQDPARDLAERRPHPLVHRLHVPVGSADATPLYVVAAGRPLALHAATASSCARAGTRS